MEENMMRIVAILSVLGLAACGGADAVGACEDYVATSNSCAEAMAEAIEMDAELTNAEDTCPETEASADEWNCLTDLMDGVDCSDFEALVAGAEAAAAAADECVGI